MTPFKIRKRLKTLLGVGSSPTPQAPALPTYEVRFDCPDGESYTVTGKGGGTLWSSLRVAVLSPSTPAAAMEPAGHAGWTSSQVREPHRCRWSREEDKGGCRGARAPTPRLSDWDYWRRRLDPHHECVGRRDHRSVS